MQAEKLEKLAEALKEVGIEPIDLMTLLSGENQTAVPEAPYVAIGELLRRSKEQETKLRALGEELTKAQLAINRILGHAHLPDGRMVIPV